MGEAAIDEFDAGNIAMASDLVARIDRVIALAEACAAYAPENNAIINAGREALAEVAAFFEVEVPNLSTTGLVGSDEC